MLPCVEPYANTIDREVANDRVARVLSSGRRSGTVLASAGPPLVEAAAPCREGAGYAKHRHLGGCIRMVAVDAGDNELCPLALPIMVFGVQCCSAACYCRDVINGPFKATACLRDR